MSQNQFPRNLKNNPCCVDLQKLKTRSSLFTLHKVATFVVESLSKKVLTKVFPQIPNFEVLYQHQVLSPNILTSDIAHTKLCVRYPHYFLYATFMFATTALYHVCKHLITAYTTLQLNHSKPMSFKNNKSMKIQNNHCLNLKIHKNILIK